MKINILLLLANVVIALILLALKVNLLVWLITFVIMYFVNIFVLKKYKWFKINKLI